MCAEREGIESATKEKALCVGDVYREVKPTDRRLTFVQGKVCFSSGKYLWMSLFPCSYAAPEVSAATRHSDAVQPLPLFVKNVSFSFLGSSSVQGSPPWPHSSVGPE